MVRWRIWARMPPVNRGFTLIEMMVILAVIAILVALLLPAVQQVRESARRMTCKSNLKQIGLALHGYHDVHNCLPPGLLRKNTSDTPCWLVFLLPHMDQAPLYAKVRPDGGDRVLRSYYQSHGTIVPGGDTVLPALRCPSSIMPTHSQTIGPAPLPPFAAGYAVVDYKACEGSNLGNGLFFKPFTVSARGLTVMRWSMVPDGLSQTLAVGESTYPGRGGNVWPSWFVSPINADGSLFMTFQDAQPAINCVTSRGGGNFWINAEADSCALSMHPGIVQFVFADGSVRAIPDSIDAQIYRYMGGRNDRQPISMDF